MEAIDRSVQEKVEEMRRAKLVVLGRNSVDRSQELITNSRQLIRQWQQRKAALTVHRPRPKAA